MKLFKDYLEELREMKSSLWRNLQIVSCTIDELKAKHKKIPTPVQKDFDMQVSMIKKVDAVIDQLDLELLD